MQRDLEKCSKKGHEACKLKQQEKTQSALTTDRAALFAGEGRTSIWYVESWSSICIVLPTSSGADVISYG
jgi:hypothetical protein